MKMIIISVLSLISFLSYGQTYVNKETFLKSKAIKVLSATTDTSRFNHENLVLKFKFIDLDDNKIKYYEAALDKTGYVSTSNEKYFPSSMAAISVMTVPFKIRSKNSQGFVTAKADVKNVGLYFPFALWDIKRYWLDGSTSSHKFTLGLLLAPMAEELSDKNTYQYFQNPNTSYSACMLSTALSGTYTYKSITFAIIPLGIDFGLDQAGKHWDNHKKYWAGFGIGIDSKLFGF